MNKQDIEEKKAIVVLDLGGRIISCNEGGLRLFEYCPFEIEGKNISDIIRGACSFVDLVEEIGDIDSRRIVKKQNLLASRKDGEEFPIELVLSWGSGAQDETLIAMIYDLTRVPGGARLEDVLEEERIYRLIAEHVEDVVLILNVESAEIIFVSESVRKQLGFSPQEIMNQPMHNYVSPESLQLMLEIYADEMKIRKTGAFDPERMTKVELKVFCKDGSPLDVEAKISWIADNTRQPTAVMTVIRDISDRKRYEAELQRKNQELEDYAHVVSHDLQTPLSGVSLNLDSIIALTEREPSARNWSNVSEIARHASANVRAAQSLVKDILKLAEAGRKSEVILSVCVSEILQRVISENEVEIDKRGIHFKILPDLGEVEANPTHIYQIFSNLVGNAVRYCDNEKPIIGVSCLGTDEYGRVRYLVRDNGSGISPEETENMFKPFHRGKGGGSGLGLATVERIVEKYQGGIKAYNDSGACFEFCLRGSA